MGFFLQQKSPPCGGLAGCGGCLGLEIVINPLGVQFASCGGQAAVSGRFQGFLCDLLCFLVSHAGESAGVGVLDPVGYSAFHSGFLCGVHVFFLSLAGLVFCFPYDLTLL